MLPSKGWALLKTSLRGDTPTPPLNKIQHHLLVRQETAVRRQMRELLVSNLAVKMEKYI